MIVKVHAIFSWRLTWLDAASQPCWKDDGFFRQKLWKRLIRGAKELPCAITTVACAVTRLTPAAWFLWQPEPQSWGITPPPAWLRRTFTSLIHHPASPTATAAHRGLALLLGNTSREWICSNSCKASPRLHSHHFLYSGIPPAEGGCWMSLMNGGGGGGGW